MNVNDMIKFTITDDSKQLGVSVSQLDNDMS
jgi:hypothetical protein